MPLVIKLLYLFGWKKLSTLFRSTEGGRPLATGRFETEKRRRAGRREEKFIYRTRVYGYWPANDENTNVRLVKPRSLDECLSLNDLGLLVSTGHPRRWMPGKVSPGR